MVGYTSADFFWDPFGLPDTLMDSFDQLCEQKHIAFCTIVSVTPLDTVLKMVTWPVDDGRGSPSFSNGLTVCKITLRQEDIAQAADITQSDVQKDSFFMLTTDEPFYKIRANDIGKRAKLTHLDMLTYDVDPAQVW